MTIEPPALDSTLLATKFTVRQYREAAKAKDRSQIADAIERRFTERYIAPVRNKPRSGFAMMAVGCLMLEALESFKRGWKKSTRQSEMLFVEFLEREAEFGVFKGRGKEFYVNVRCGIFHQAETTGGWRIRRVGDLLDDKTINAEKFINALSQVLKAYCGALKTKSWGSKEWNKVNRKMNHICENCQP